MRLRLLTLFICISIVSYSQVELSTYQVDEYYTDTIINHSGPVLFSGKGSIGLSSSLETSFVTGMRFVFVVDAYDQGEAPIHSAFKTVNGVRSEMHVGDTVDLPLSFEIFAGEVDFRVLHMGIPEVAGEKYNCTLLLLATLGDDYNVEVYNEGDPECEVALLASSSTPEFSNTPLLFPNPASDYIRLPENDSYSELVIYDMLGKEKARFSKRELSDKMELQSLSQGVYLYKLTDRSGKVYSDKLVVK